MTITRMGPAIWLTAAVSHGLETAPTIIICIRYDINGRLVIGPLPEYPATRMFANGGVSVKGMDASSKTELHAAPYLSNWWASAAGTYVVFHRVEKLETRLSLRTGRSTRSPMHSDSGVMKGHWTGRDFSEMRIRPLGFIPEELELSVRVSPSMRV